MSDAARQNARTLARATAGSTPVPAAKDWTRVRVVAAVDCTTDRAIYLRRGMGSESVPRSLVSDNGDGSFAMPRWLATERGFI
jgi:hypothetical protein